MAIPSTSLLKFSDVLSMYYWEQMYVLSFDIILQLSQLIGYGEVDHSRFLDHGWRKNYVGHMLNVIELEFLI